MPPGHSRDIPFDLVYAEIAATASDRPRFGLWPLLISAWKRLPGERP